ncbi:MAG: CPBP family intramembrane metalloprotease [Actinomycetota bacterium]|nr:CPBP family intramembrane metalloprotease [Actinomycetota bacterium]
MHPQLRGRTAAAAVALALVLAAWNNVIVIRLPGYPGSYVAGNVIAAGVLLAAARAGGLSWQELGLARSRLPAGARWGLVCVALVALAYAAALMVPPVRPLLGDERVAGLDGAELAYDVLVRIPLGTVLWEELAFRGVLLAVLARLLPRRTAVAVGAAVFGVWHVRPTLSAVMINNLDGGPVLVGLAVLLGCLATTAAGVVLTWLRLRSGSLLAPLLLHLATNSLGALTVAAAVRLD